MAIGLSNLKRTALFMDTIKLLSLIRNDSFQRKKSSKSREIERNFDKMEPLLIQRFHDGRFIASIDK